MGGSIKSSMTPGVSLSPATVSVIALLSTNAAAPNALAVDGISGNCRRWKAVLLDLSPLGPRLYLPTGWSADGVVVGSVEVAPAGGGSTSEVAWAWAPRTLSGYAIPAGVSRLPGLGETAEAPIESAACGLPDSGLAVGVSADSAVRWDLTSVGTPVAAFAISPPPSAASAAFGIDRAAGVTVAGMTTATCLAAVQARLSRVRSSGTASRSQARPCPTSCSRDRRPYSVNPCLDSRVTAHRFGESDTTRYRPHALSSCRDRVNSQRRGHFDGIRRTCSSNMSLGPLCHPLKPFERVTPTPLLDAHSRPTRIPSVLSVPSSGRI
jgi:hypothetical protein